MRLIVLGVQRHSKSQIGLQLLELGASSIPGIGIAKLAALSNDRSLS